MVGSVVAVAEAEAVAGTALAASPQYSLPAGTAAGPFLWDVDAEDAFVALISVRLTVRASDVSLSTHTLQPVPYSAQLL